MVTSHDDYVNDSWLFIFGILTFPTLYFFMNNWFPHPRLINYSETYSHPSPHVNKKQPPIHIITSTAYTNSLKIFSYNHLTMQVSTVLSKITEPMLWIISAVLWVAFWASSRITVVSSAYFIFMNFFTFTLELTKTNLVKSTNMFKHCDS